MKREAREWLIEHYLDQLDPEDRLKGLDPEERLKGLNPGYHTNLRSPMQTTAWVRSLSLSP